MNTPIKYRKDLWQLLQAIPGDTVEVGVAEGNFSHEILNWSIDRKHYLVDNWAWIPNQRGDGGFSQDWHEQNFARVQERTAPYGDRAVILRGKSAEMAERVPSRSLALVYIDADHSYLGVKQDINSWLSKLVPGGVMAFHDFFAPQYGVGRAVKEFCLRYRVQLHEILEDKAEDGGAYFHTKPTNYVDTV